MAEFFIYKDKNGWKGKAWKDHLGELPNGKYKVKIEKFNNRSLPQNSYLHGVMLPLVKDGLRQLGWDHIRTIEDAKDFLKEKFLKEQVVNSQTGEVITRIKKTSELSRGEFSVFKEEVQKFAAEELNVYIPDPGEQLELIK